MNRLWGVSKESNHPDQSYEKRIMCAAFEQLDASAGMLVYLLRQTCHEQVIDSTKDEFKTGNFEAIFCMKACPEQDPPHPQLSKDVVEKIWAQARQQKVDLKESCQKEKIDANAKFANMKQAMMEELNKDIQHLKAELTYTRQAFSDISFLNVDDNGDGRKLKECSRRLSSLCAV